MWEFMSKYADNFWKAGDYAYEVFTVIMAWAITLGVACFVFLIIAVIGLGIAEKIKELKIRGRSNGKEE